MENPIRVGIVEDGRRTREGLRALLDGSADFRCAGVWSSMEEALAARPQNAPDVILTDVGSPGMSGIDGVPELRRLHPGTTLVVLTVYAENERVFEALRAGAAGYPLRNMQPAGLLDALRDAVDNGAEMPAEAARKVIEIFERCRPPENALHNLSTHEVVLLRLLAAGHTFESAGFELRAGAHAVAFDVKSIYTKLQVHSKSETAARALQESTG